MNKNTLLISRNIVVFPSSKMTIEVGRPLSINAIHWAIEKNNSEIVVVCQKDYEIDNPGVEDLYKIGTLSKVKLIKTESDNSIQVELEGVSRVRILKLEISEVEEQKESWTCDFEVLKDKNITYAKNRELISELIYQIENIFDKNNPNVTLIREILEKKSNKIPVIVDIASSLWPLGAGANIPSIKQRWLEELDIPKRINLILSGEYIHDNLKDELDDLINKKVHNNISKQQKEFYLRERIKVIKEELGEGAAREDDISKIRQRLKTEPFPQHVKDKISAEINKLEYTSGMSNESVITRNYIDWVMSLPWHETSKDEENIKKVEKTLEKNHYGLDKVKERILEFLAVQKRTKQQGGSIICLVGPPGVGKTSLAQSIAEALNKKYVKISLGGINDESEIRGHRKTYVGSMPGRIIKGLKSAKVKNPLFLLDEIDKLTASHRGDPASALLEVLDPSQNSHFSDNYIEEEYDLSKVMFIATANYAENIPPPLYDRLEIIELTSYTENEKLEIAKAYLVPEVLKESGIKNQDLKFSDEAIKHVIQRYTREAGVRELKRCLSQIARKFVRKQEENSKIKSDVQKPADVTQYLKKELYDFTLKDEIAIPGIVNGMAYSPFGGGDLLPIEVNYYKGKGTLVLTGNLKEIIRESASVALGYVKANAESFGLSHIDFQEIDINIHFPSGGVPKDGPSAGVALTTAIISSLKKVAVPNYIAMTGEITLRGKVLIIGGVKEKVISAVRGGITKIFMPKEDERYLDEVPKEVLEKVEIILVSEYKTIFAAIFDPKKTKEPVSKRKVRVESCEQLN